MMRMPLQTSAIDELFKWRDTRNLLLLLSRTPYAQFTITELIAKLDIKSRDSLTKLIDALERANMIKTTRSGRKRLISINRDLLEKPEDTFLLIPQDEYRTVVRDYVSALRTKLKKLHAIILFGSVAQGTADRASDIDVFIVADAPLQAERAAIELAKKYLKREAGRERYSIKPLSESIETLSKMAMNKPKETAKIIRDGIILHADKKFDKFLETVKL